MLQTVELVRPSVITTCEDVSSLNWMVNTWLSNDAVKGAVVDRSSGKGLGFGSSIPNSISMALALIDMHNIIVNAVNNFFILMIIYYR